MEKKNHTTLDEWKKYQAKNPEWTEEKEREAIRKDKLLCRKANKIAPELLQDVIELAIGCETLNGIEYYYYDKIALIKVNALVIDRISQEALNDSLTPLHIQQVLIPHDQDVALDMKEVCTVYQSQRYPVAITKTKQYFCFDECVLTYDVIGYAVWHTLYQEG